jgi:serine/threonine protein phosphatase PrpC
MKVNELIERLQAMPEDAEVYIMGSDGLWDYSTPENVEHCTMTPMFGKPVTGVWVWFG